MSIKQMKDLKEAKAIILNTFKEYTKEMEGYSYYGSNPGISEDDYEEIADRLLSELFPTEEKGE